MRIYVYDDYTKPLPPEKFTPIRGQHHHQGNHRRHDEGNVLSARCRPQRSVPRSQSRHGPPRADRRKDHLEDWRARASFRFHVQRIDKGTRAGGSDIDRCETSRRAGRALHESRRPAPSGTVAAPARKACGGPTTPAKAAPTSSQAAVAPVPNAPAPARRTPRLLRKPHPDNPDPPVMINPALINVAIPSTLEEIVTEIGVRNRQISELVKAGRFADIWLPAFEAKDLALATNSYGAGMPTYKRRASIRRSSELLHAAWMLDSFGDLGNREQVTAAYARFSSAVTAIDALLPGGAAMTRRTRRIVMTAVVAGAVGMNVERGETHKPITSSHTYNEDVFPILRERCGRCHVEDGVAPMSLMTYQEAFPWGESVRAEVIAKHMPPWHAEESAIRFKNQPTITSTEIDKILVWVSGGSPQGNLQHMPPRVALHNDWAIGKPDLVLPLERSRSMRTRTRSQKSSPSRLAARKPGGSEPSISCPGTPAIVRDAIMSIKADPSTAPHSCGSRRARGMDSR